jgi:hypothetical protein
MLTGRAWVVFGVDLKMERFAINSRRIILAAATALLTAGTITAASAQTQDRSNTRMNAGQNLSTSGQMNAQGPNAQVSGVNAGQQFQQGRNFSQNVSTE